MSFYRSVFLLYIFALAACDNSGSSATNNAAPVATPQTINIVANEAYAITLTGTDRDGDSLSYHIDSPPEFGVLSGSAPDVTYTPNANYLGPDSFIFFVNDGSVNSAETVVAITIAQVTTPQNVAPTANALVIVLAQDSTATITLTGDDAEQAPLNFRLVSQPANGVLSGTAPDLVYTPNLGYSGTDSFTYVANDGDLDSLAATASITITPSAPINTPPVATPQTINLTANDTYAITLAGTDSDGDSLSYHIANPPGFGVLSGSAPNITYSPNTNYVGPDSFTFFVNDGLADSAVAVATITVAPNNGAPLVSGLILNTTEDTALAITLIGVDPEDDPLNYSIETQPLFGLLSGNIPNLTYTPTANYAGEDSFTFRADDGELTSNLGTVRITITPVNDAPTANALTVVLAQNSTATISLSGNDTEQTPLSFRLVSQPTNGGLSGTSPDLVYTPNLGYSGADSFTYEANDGDLDSLAATASITITPNAAPVATPQTINVAVNEAYAITLAGTDGDGDSLSYHIDSPPKFGVLSGSAPNLSYRPNTNYIGLDSFSFFVNDGTENSATATVSITVAQVDTPLNDAPLAIDLVLSTAEDTAITLTLVGLDPENDPLIYWIETQPLFGLISGDIPNLTYTPAANYAGDDSFTFKAGDGEWVSNLGTVRITIAPINDAPTANALVVVLAQDTTAAIRLAGNDTEQAALSFQLDSQPANGLLSGTIPNLIYTPNLGYTGPDSFTYIADDGVLTSLAATASITVNPLASVSLNDTGLRFGGNYPSGNNASCIGETIAEQDCAHGRDASHADNSDGQAGFSYTKLDASGADLPASATAWSCVKDNVTGLIWERKTGGNGIQADEGLHDADDGYSWYSTDSLSNGGNPGFADENKATCQGYSGSNSANLCNTEAYVARVNSATLCGAVDWRLPTRAELRSLVNLSQAAPLIDRNYFPNAQSNPHWSASPYGLGSYYAWYVQFSNGGSYFFGRNRESHVRLVRTEP